MRFITLYIRQAIDKLDEAEHEKSSGLSINKFYWNIMCVCMCVCMCVYVCVYVCVQSVSERYFCVHITFYDVCSGF